MPPCSPSCVLSPSPQADKLRARFHYNLDSDIDPEWIAPDVLDHLRNEYSAREVRVAKGEGFCACEVRDVMKGLRGTRVICMQCVGGLSGKELVLNSWGT